MFKRTIALILILLLIGLAASASAQETNRAGLVVMLVDGTTLIRCVEFTEPEITGFELLTRSGLDVETASVSLGAAICRLEGTGCPGSDCFCQCKGGGDCVYWSYWHLQDDQWRYFQAGAGMTRVQNGTVQGWTFGPGTPQDALEPPPTTFDEICAASMVAPEAVTVEPTVVATAVPDPIPTESSSNQWLGYGLLGLVVLVAGGLLLARGRKGQK
ncbi:MAG: hypothetical protein H6667_21820 [Ardenticatenaceae bacterium]|nr:hypothetical protein [Ardenticatenaceae bacterium]